MTSSNALKCVVSNYETTTNGIPPNNKLSGILPNFIWVIGAEESKAKATTTAMLWAETQQSVAHLLPLNIKKVEK